MGAGAMVGNRDRSNPRQPLTHYDYNGLPGPKTENRKPKTENRKPKTENRKPKTGLPHPRRCACIDIKIPNATSKDTAEVPP